ncbi:MAG: hypothetical protein MUO26_14110 [Methanotrichaceae archaeon]|nr:hypothetical protein [Methanotrichaceae archaeon]
MFQLCKNRARHIVFWPSFISLQDLSHIGGFFTIWSRRSGWGIHCDVVNTRMFELDAAKEILAEIYDILYELSCSIFFGIKRNLRTRSSKRPKPIEISCS